MYQRLATTLKFTVDGVRGRTLHQYYAQRTCAAHLRRVVAPVSNTPGYLAVTFCSLVRFSSFTYRWKRRNLYFWDMPIIYWLNAYLTRILCVEDV
jgi:hypothetical protein